MWTFANICGLFNIWLASPPSLSLSSYFCFLSFYSHLRTEIVILSKNVSSKIDWKMHCKTFLVQTFFKKRPFLYLNRLVHNKLIFFCHVTFIKRHFIKKTFEVKKFCHALVYLHLKYHYNPFIQTLGIHCFT